MEFLGLKVICLSLFFPIGSERFGTCEILYCDLFLTWCATEDSAGIISFSDNGLVENVSSNILIFADDVIFFPLTSPL